MKFAKKIVDHDKEVIQLEKESAGIPVCYCFDRNYANYTAVSSYSLHKNSSIPPQIFWVVPAKDFDYCLQLMNSINKFGMDITLIKVNSEHFEGWQGHNIAYYRLLISQLIDLEKIIYIDSDTLIFSDLSELFNLDLKNNLVGGVLDPGGYTSNIFHHLKPPEPYLNAGLFIMNLALMREMNFIEGCKRIYFSFNGEINYGDQDVINLACVDRKHVIDSKYCRLMQVNDETYSNFEEARDKNDVIHFVGGVKPWMKWCNPRAYDVWWDFANKLSLDDLQPQEISNVIHILLLAQCHDINNEFQAASRLKSQVIMSFMKK